MAGWYRRFIPDFARRARPLADLSRQDDPSTPFLWLAAAAAAFDDLKGALVAAPVLRRPDY
ncbi:hypothetical protein CF336_g9365, partial [Tilletia laevis]